MKTILEWSIGIFIAWLMQYVLSYIGREYFSMDVSPWFIMICVMSGILYGGVSSIIHFLTQES